MCVTLVTVLIFLEAQQIFFCVALSILTIPLNIKWKLFIFIRYVPYILICRWKTNYRILVKNEILGFFVWHCFTELLGYVQLKSVPEGRRKWIVKVFVLSAIRNKSKDSKNSEKSQII